MGSLTSQTINKMILSHIIYFSIPLHSTPMLFDHFLALQIHTATSIILISLDAICNPSKYKDGKLVLTKYKLSWMINPKKKKTFLYVPEPFTGVGEERERVFISAGTDHAEDLMKSNLTTPPEEFWITNTPCPRCARGLMAWYSSSSKKAKIHVTKFTAGKEAQIDLATECLAKMMYQGFTFVLWDWPDFNNGFIRNEECTNVLKKAFENASTLDALSTQYNDLRNALEEASKLSKDQSWISGVAGKCPASQESKSSLLAMVEILARN